MTFREIRALTPEGVLQLVHECMGWLDVQRSQDEKNGRFPMLGRKVGEYSVRCELDELTLDLMNQAEATLTNEEYIIFRGVLVLFHNLERVVSAPADARGRAFLFAKTVKSNQP